MTTMTANNELANRIHEWYLRAGSPTVRQLAVDARTSSTTVHNTLKGVSMPTWRTLMPIIEALGGDVEEARALYAGTKPPARDPEINAVAQCAMLLTTLSDEQRQRVMRFLVGKFGTGEDVIPPGV